MIKFAKRAFGAKKKANGLQPAGSGSFADFRSDTVTKPCDKMRDAMANAVVGDDIYGDDLTMVKLENDMARLLGKEKALFTTSGTQANLIAMMLMCPMKGESVIFGDNCHLAHYERGGIGSVAGVMPTVLVNQPDGTLDLKAINRAIFPGEDPHIVKVRGLSLESSQNNCNGKAIRPEYISQVKKICKKNKMKLHLDGARSWNAAVYLDMQMDEMVKDFDLVNVCLSKGLGCPAGSMIAGNAADIDRARTLRKMLGGGMRQVGHLAACGLVTLMDWQEKLLVDNQNAAFMASELQEIAGVEIDPLQIETNIVRFTIDPKSLRKNKLDYFKVRDLLKDEHGILCNAGFLNDNIRFVTHRNVSRADCERTLKAIKSILA